MSSPPKPASPWAVKIANEGKEQGVPVEKIRQKLVLEGLEPDLINVVLKGSGAGGDFGPEEHIEPSSPSTSPQRQQLSARKFHDMLLVGLPPAVVRQKMAMEGCQPEEINTFFASEEKTGEPKAA